jgi:methylamine---glutamate N-methyltransferase subunit B
MPAVDLAETPLRALNARLHALPPGSNETDWDILNPRGLHAVAVGLDAPLDGGGARLDRLLRRRHEQTGRDHHPRQRRPRRRREHDVGHRHRRRRRLAIRRRLGPRRPPRDPRQRRLALRHLDEGHRHRRRRLGRPHVGLHGPEGQPRRLRRRGRGLGRLDLRGPPLRARLGEIPRRRLRREADAPRAQALLASLLDRAGIDADPAAFRRYGSARTLYHFHVDRAGAY